MNPLLITKKKDAGNLMATEISGYWYEWGKNTFALAMGHGSFFNHSYEANAEYEMDEDSKEIFFTAVKSIKKGEEIFINYNGHASSKKKVWFDQE